MIPRYTRPKIEKIWSVKNKFTIWTEIECLIAEKLSIIGIIPKKDAKQIREKAKFNVKEIEELRKRVNLAHQMGGPEKIKRQHDAGRLTIRERIEAILDRDSFHEIGTISGLSEYGPDGSLKSFRASNCIFGRGQIDGRTIVLVGDDFTVRGGAADASTWEKQVAADQMAYELHLPIVRFVEGTRGGASQNSNGT